MNVRGEGVGDMGQETEDLRSTREVCYIPTYQGRPEYLSIS